MADRQEILKEWLEGDFKSACVNDGGRIRESISMLKVGLERGDPFEAAMSVAIGTFVRGLIDGDPPVGSEGFN